jgi:hypothetical protein
MRRLIATVTLITALTAAWLATPQAFAQPTAQRVVLVLAPYLTWDDVTPASTPTIWSLSRQGAIGDINARSRARQIGEPSSPLEGALTISAGAWAVPVFDAPAAFSVDERYEVGTAAEAFRRATGDEVGTSSMVFLGMPITQRENAKRSFEVVLGTLGEEITKAGGVTAAVGNSDIGYATGEQRSVRPAVLAAMDADGLVALGDVSKQLLRADPSAPFGIETDLDQFERTLRKIDEQTKAHGGPALVVLDPGDAYRASKFESQVTPEIGDVHRRRALTTLDKVVSQAREVFPEDTLVVVSQSTRNETLGRPEGLGPIVIAGSGWSGYVTSNSTQRDGLVTNLDVTATILQTLGIKRPVQVLGNGIRLLPAPTDLNARIEQLKRMDRTASAIDAAKAEVVNTFVILTVIILLLGAFVLVRSRKWTDSLVRTWVTVLRLAMLLVLSVPVSSWLMFAWMRWPASATVAIVALLVTVAVVWVAAVLLSLRVPHRVPVAVLSLLTVVVLSVDQLLGAPYSFTNFFGYSPILAARFYGMGNEAAAVLFGASIVGFALLLDQWPMSRWVRPAVRYGVPIVGAVITALAAAPFWGANIGVAVWGIVGFWCAWILFSGRRLSWKSALVAGMVIVAVVGVFAAVDIYSGGSQTHLARSLGSAQQGGLVELWNIVQRKAETNVRVLTHTNWAYILIATLGFLTFMRWRPQGDFAETLTENPYFADAITVTLIAGLAAYFSEDSGIVIPALIIFYVGVAIVWLMLARIMPDSKVSPATATDTSGR